MKTEQGLTESARDRLRRGEALIALAVRDINGVVTANTEAGEAGKANAAFLAQAKIEAALAGLKIAHAEATEILLANWPGFGGPVVLGGGGGRG
jgi:hypothetical protein